MAASILLMSLFLELHVQFAAGHARLARNGIDNIDKIDILEAGWDRSALNFFLTFRYV
jgi:hypothetical protein